MAAWLRTWQQFVCCPRCLCFYQTTKQLLISHRSCQKVGVFPWPRSWEPWLLGGCFPEGSCSGRAESGFAMGTLGWNVKIFQNSWTVCFKILKIDEDSKKCEGNLLVMAVTVCCSLRGKLLHLCVSLFWHSCWCQEENDTLLAQRRISGFWPRNLTAALYYPASKQISFDLVLATQYLLRGACCHHQFTGISRAKVSPECCRSVPFSALTITSSETVWEMNAPEVFQMRCFKTRIVDDCWRRDWVCVCVWVPVLVDISFIRFQVFHRW